MNTNIEYKISEFYINYFRVYNYTDSDFKRSVSFLIPIAFDLLYLAQVTLN